MGKKTEKYYELLDRLADAIQKGKSADVIERIKDKIEDIENKIYLNKLKGKDDE